MQDEPRLEHVCQINVPDFPKFVVEATVKFLYTGRFEMTSHMKNLMQKLLVDIIRIDANLVLPDSQEFQEHLGKNIPPKVSNVMVPSNFVGKDAYGNLVNRTSKRATNKSAKSNANVKNYRSGDGQKTLETGHQSDQEEQNDEIWSDPEMFDLTDLLSQVEGIILQLFSYKLFKCKISLSPHINDVTQICTFSDPLICFSYVQSCLHNVNV